MGNEVGRARCRAGDRRCVGTGAATVRAVVAEGASALIVDLPGSSGSSWHPSWGSACGSPRRTYAMKIKCRRPLRLRLSWAPCGSQSTVPGCDPGTGDRQARRAAAGDLSDGDRHQPGRYLQRAAIGGRRP